MTQIDFHSNITDKINYICRLVRKARAADCEILIFDSNKENLALLDEALWIFSAKEFLPHVFASDALASTTPIILCDDEKISLHHKNVLINLNQEVPSFFQEFNRVFEIISTDEEDAKNGRLRYRHYQQLGFAPNHVIAKTL